MKIPRANLVVIPLVLLLLFGAFACVYIRTTPKKPPIEPALDESTIETRDPMLDQHVLNDRNRLEELERLARDILDKYSGEGLVTDAEARKSIPEGTAFVRFNVCDGTTLVCIYYGPTEPLYVYSVNVRAHRLETIIEGFYAALYPASSNHGPQHRERVVQYGRKIFKLLFHDADGQRGKALEYVRRAKSLVIAGEGPLARFPFSALVVNENGNPRYLGAEKAISYVPDLATFHLIHTVDHPERQATDDTALIMGASASPSDPDSAALDLESTSEVRGEDESGRHDAHSCPVCAGDLPAALPGTFAEAMRIARFYGIRPLTGDEATEPAFRERARRARIIHLAFHFFVCPTDPLRSSLILASDDRRTRNRDSDGRLEIQEIANMSLNADLVVLAACRSGVCVDSPRSATVSAADAFLHAGARSVVATHWPIEDHVSGPIMSAFHHHLSKGVGKAEALRLAIRFAADGEHLEPRHWASFFLMGDPT